MLTYTFSTLYDTSSLGKIKQWSIKVIIEDDKSVIMTEAGYLDGKITVFTRDITKGKNLGKANETTHFEEAISEAQSKWNKQKDKGYSEIVTNPVIQGESEVGATPVLF